MPSKISPAVKRRPAIRNPAADHFVACLAHATHVRQPFDYWLLNNIFPERITRDLAALPFTPPAHPIFSGRRESNNATRVYFTQENQKKYRVCRDTVTIFSDPVVVKCLQKTTLTNLSEGHLRIEYCLDASGFWLEPHLDISVKLFTMLVYLSDDPNLFDAGTDIFDSSPEHKLVASAPYEHNAGMIFIPGRNTWHGFSKRPIHGLRKSLIINYVTPEWINKGELAYQ